MEARSSSPTRRAADQHPVDREALEEASRTALLFEDHLGKALDGSKRGSLPGKPVVYD